MSGRFWHEMDARWVGVLLHEPDMMRGPNSSLKGGRSFWFVAAVLSW